MVKSDRPLINYDGHGCLQIRPSLQMELARHCTAQSAKEKTRQERGRRARTTRPGRTQREMVDFEDATVRGGGALVAARQ